MERQAMNLMIDEELGHIGRGDRGSAQNEFRMLYNRQRRIDLGKNSETPRLKSVAQAVEATQRNAPGFVPRYNADYFRASAR